MNEERPCRNCRRSRAKSEETFLMFDDIPSGNGTEIHTLFQQEKRAGAAPGKMPPVSGRWQ